MQEIIANIIGIIAVILFVLSYQLKKRNHIIICNTISRIFYIIQYVLLGALSGAVLDIVGVFAAIIAQKKDVPFFKRFFIILVIVVNAFIIGIGLLLYKTPVDLLPIFGVVLQIGAFWFSKETHIRIVSFIAAPFWFAYNIISGAYGSCIGDAITICSIGFAILRYDFFKTRKTAKNEP